MRLLKHKAPLVEGVGTNKREISHIKQIRFSN